MTTNYFTRNAKTTNNTTFTRNRTYNSLEINLKPAEGNTVYSLTSNDVTCVVDIAVGMVVTLPTSGRTYNWFIASDDPKISDDPFNKMSDIANSIFAKATTAVNFELIAHVDRIFRLIQNGVTFEKTDDLPQWIR